MRCRPPPLQLDRFTSLLKEPLPAFDAAYWVLLIVLTSIALVPLSVAYAYAEGMGACRRGWRQRGRHVQTVP